MRLMSRHVYPLDSSFASRADPAIRPSLTRGRSEFVYFPGMIRIPEGSAPDFKNKSWTIAAEVTIPQGGANGVLATTGGRYGGWALLMQDGKPGFAYAYSNQPEHKYRVVSDQPLAPGTHIIRVKFEYAGGGIGKAATATLLVDEKQVAQGQIPQTIGVRFSLDETFDVGEDTGTPVLARGVRGQNAVSVHRHAQEICRGSRPVEAQRRRTTPVAPGIGEGHGSRPMIRESLGVGLFKRSSPDRASDRPADPESP